MGIFEKLENIQQELKAPKGQYNSFGKFSYRSCEDILEAVKPLLKANNCTLTISDELVNIGERYYIRAEAKLTDVEDGHYYANAAYAREVESKSGMDGAQITGTASSYARKYALNGLFCIDDTKDADTDEHAKQTGLKGEKATANQVKMLNKIANADQKKVILDHYGVSEFTDLTKAQASGTISQLKGE